MTIILFLVDTSSSMCQKAYVNGVQKSYLDIAKGAVETFLKYRQRTQDCLGDRYMLLTFEEPPANVKAGWMENHATFMNELKNLQSTGLTSMGESLKNAFDLLNLNRMQSGIDTYGQGRCPFYLEPSVIVVITDGGRYSYRNGVHQEIILPLSTQIPGTKFTKEPFRWDQRLFSLVLRMSGNKVDERVDGKVPHDDSPIERMCEVTGGRSYRVRSHYVLNQCIESLVQKVKPGVVLRFEPMLPKDNGNGAGGGAEPPQDIVFQPTKKMIYVQKHITQKTFSIGYWPLPEPYWPDTKAVTLPARDAHPKLRIVTPAVDEPQLVRNFPVDKYEIEASPLTLQILQKREMNKCWQVIISNGMHGFELPFGYLKAAPNFTQVHLYVLAYNYPALLPLLHDLIHKYNMSPPNDLMYKFNAYVRSIPPYYGPFLRKALLNIAVPYPLLQFLLPENVDNYLSPTIANQLKHIKNTAKQDQENLCLKVYKQLKQPKPPYRQMETAKLNPGVQLRRDLVRHPLLRDTFTKLHTDIQTLSNYTIVVPQMTRQASAKSYRHPSEIPRRDLIEEIARMRETFLRPTPSGLVTKDSGHCLPIAEMGNYQEYLKNKDNNPLREIEPTNVRQHMFGNPYKKDKHMVMVDEADLGEVAPMKANGGGGGGAGAPGVPPPVGVPGVVGVGPPPIMGLGAKKMIDASRVRKRKAGPIRKDFVFRRTSTDVQLQLRPQSPSGMSTASSGSTVSAPAGLNLNTLSDYEDDSNSDSASMSSGMSEDGDPDRLVVAFDEEDECLPLNGHVRNFINGTSDDSSCDSDVSMSGSGNANASALSGNGTGAMPTGGGGGGVTIGGAAAAAGALITPHTAELANGLLPPAMHAAALAPHPYLSMYGAHAAAMYSDAPSAAAAATPVPTYAPHQLNGSPFGGITAPAATNAMPHATTTTLPLMSTASTPSSAQQQPPPPPQQPQPHHVMHHHNDINDAQEISRILQQCHNGNTSNSNTPASHASSTATASTSLLLGGSYDVTAGDLRMDVDAAGAAQAAAAPAHTYNHNNSSCSTSAAAAAAALSNSFDNLKRETHAVHSNNIGSLNNHTANHLSNHNNYSNSNNGNGNSSNNRRASASMSPSPPPPLSEEQREQARKHNQDLRALIFRDIRRPGRNYSELLEHLNQVRGDYDMKSQFVQMCIYESSRFRRRQMVNSIEDWWRRNQQAQVSTASGARLATTTSLDKVTPTALRDETNQTDTFNNCPSSWTNTKTNMCKSKYKNNRNNIKSNFARNSLKNKIAETRLALQKPK